MRGFTLIEMLAVIAIMLGIGTLFVGGLNTYEQAQALSLGSRDVASFIESAHTRALSGQGGAAAGVHIGTSTLTLFSGSYSADDPNNELLPLDDIMVSSLSLTGGGADIIFDPLTGNTSDPGTLTLTTVASSSAQKIITVSSAGVVTIQ